MEYYKHPAVSNSRLTLINPEQGGSYLKYLKGFEEEEKYSRSLERGSAVHLALLEPELFIPNDTDKPSDAMTHFLRKVKEYRKEMPIQKAIDTAKETTGYGKSWKQDTLLKKLMPYYKFYKEMYNGGLSRDTYDTLLKCVAAVKANEEAMQLMEGGFNEHPMFRSVTLTVDGIDQELELKAKIDNWTIDYDNKVVTLNDIKTTGDPISLFGGYMEQYPVKQFVKGSFHKYRYYRQMAFYLDMLLDHLSSYGLGGDWVVNVNMIVVETHGNYECRVFKVSDHALKYGRDEYVKLLKLLIQYDRGNYRRVETL